MDELEFFLPALKVFVTAYEWLLGHKTIVLMIAGILAGFALAAIFLRFAQGKSICRRSRLYQIAVPQGSEVPPFAAEQMFSMVHGLQENWWRRLWHGPEHIALEIAADRTGIRFYLWTPARIGDSVVQTIQSAYEQADIQLLTEDYLRGPGLDALRQAHEFPRGGRGCAVAGARLVLQRAIGYPIKTLREFDQTDPLAGLTAALAGLEEGEGLVAQLLLQPGGDREIGRQARRLQRQIEGGRSYRQPAPDGRAVVRAYRDYTPEEQQMVKSIGGKHAKLPFRIALNLLALAPTGPRAYARLRGLAAAYEQFNIAILNGWQRRNVWFLPRLLFARHVRERAFPLLGRRKLHHPLVGEHDVLTIEELASLWHLPHPAVVETPGIVWSLSRKRAAPAPAAGPTATGGLVLARTAGRGVRRDVVLPPEALYQHMSVIGLPGAGKSTMLARLALECIQQGIGLVLLDPHGDLCENLLARIPAAARARVIYFNPAADFDRPMGLNFLEAEPGQHPAQVKSEVLTMLTHLFGQELIGPRSSYVLGNCIQTLQELGGMTILEVQNLLLDATFRETAILRVRNAGVRFFWYSYYNPLVQKNQRLQLETISPVLNKIGAFATDERVARVVGQAASSFQLREVIDTGQALLCNLSQGRLGVDNAQLFGGAIASRVIQAALARENVPEAERRPAVLIADEFHTFVGPAFAKGLAQVRKYHLGMVLACQFLGQLDSIPEMRAAFPLAGTKVVFKVAAGDAVSLAADLTGFYSAEDLARLDPYQAVIQPAAKRGTIPYSAETIPLEEAPTWDPAGAEEIRQAGRARYGRPAAEVDQELAQRVPAYLKTATAAEAPPRRSGLHVQ